MKGHKVDVMARHVGNIHFVSFIQLLHQCAQKCLFWICYTHPHPHTPPHTHTLPHTPTLTLTPYSYSPPIMFPQFFKNNFTNDGGPTTTDIHYTVDNLDY